MTTERARRGRGRPPHPDILTPREWQVLDLLRQGLTNEQIAQRLDISLAGAKYHVSEILTKLGLTSREQAAAWQPEAVVTRWWQLATTWLPRRAWPLAAAAGALAALGALAWFILGASAGEDDDTAASQPSASASPAQTAAATPTPFDVSFPPLSISNPEDTKLFFIRGATGFLEPGALWMSDLDGSRAEVLVSEPVVERVMGVVTHWQTGNATVYYYNSEIISETPEEGRRGRHSVSSLDLVTGQRTDVHSYETRNGQLEGAEDITEDGRHLAYTDVFGLAILDTAGSEPRRVLNTDPEACNRPQVDIGRCKYYAVPSWSPDGTHLVVFEGGYEGGYSLLLNPFDQSLAPVTFELLAGRPRWSNSGQSLCLVDSGSRDMEVGVIIAKAPDWQAQKFLAGYKTAVPAGHFLSFNLLFQCVWLDEMRIALLYSASVDTALERNPHREVLILNTNDGIVTSLPEHRELFGARTILAVRNGDLLISSPQTSSATDPIGDTLTPEVVDIETNARHPILTTEDWVVAAVPADSIAP